VTILVTGAAGFAGSHVVQTLAGAGNIINGRATTEEIAPLATWQQVDLLDRDAVALR
jgi:nucleoside-diphosphate-sugar epimerase